MSDITFKKNKPKYLVFTIVLLIILFFTIYFSIAFVSNPSKYIYALMPNEFIVFILGIMGILGSLVLSYIIIKSVSNGNFLIRMNPDGLFIGIIQYSNKLVLWNDIVKIEKIEINNTKHIIIYIKNIDYYMKKETGIEKYFFKSRTKKYGTPFILNVSALDSNFNNIFDSIVWNWRKFKTSNEDN